MTTNNAVSTHSWTSISPLSQDEMSNYPALKMPSRAQCSCSWSGVFAEGAMLLCPRATRSPTLELLRKAPNRAARPGLDATTAVGPLEGGHIMGAVTVQRPHPRARVYELSYDWYVTKRRTDGKLFADVTALTGAFACGIPTCACNLANVLHATEVVPPTKKAGGAIINRGGRMMVSATTEAELTTRVDRFMSAHLQHLDLEALAVSLSAVTTDARVAQALDSPGAHASASILITHYGVKQAGIELEDDGGVTITYTARNPVPTEGQALLAKSLIDAGAVATTTWTDDRTLVLRYGASNG